MKKHFVKKLVLPKETLRNLDVARLEEAAGGGGPPITRDGCSCGNIRSTCPAP